MPPVNLAVLRGALSKTAEARLLSDGSTVWELDVMIRQEGRASGSVPVSWAAPPAGVDPASWSAGDELLVVGSVRRRFYRAGGATVSRTDVLAEAVVPARHASVPPPSWPTRWPVSNRPEAHAANPSGAEVTEYAREHG